MNLLGGILGGKISIHDYHVDEHPRHVTSYQFIFDAIISSIVWNIKKRNISIFSSHFR